LKKAYTAADADYLTEDEKNLIFYTNLARMNGPLFEKTILEQYLEDKIPTSYTRSLRRELKKLEPLSILAPEKDLYNVAKGHASLSGKRGTTGHQRFEKRYGPLMGKYNDVAENCAYGYEDPMVILIELLIDEGIRNLGHRKNLLNPNYNSLGVAIRPHKKFRYNAVMSFGRKVN